MKGSEVIDIEEDAQNPKLFPEFQTPIIRISDI